MANCHISYGISLHVGTGFFSPQPATKGTPHPGDGKEEYKCKTNLQLPDHSK